MKSDTQEVHGPCCGEGSQTKYRLRPHASITRGGGQEEQEQQVLRAEGECPLGVSGLLLS